MAVILGSVTLSEVLNWEEEETSTIPVKRIVRKDGPTTQAEYFTRTPRIITIEARCTKTTKDAIRTLKNQHNWQPLYDYDGTFIDNVWLETPTSRWQGDVDYDYPWLMRITLICSST